MTDQSAANDPAEHPPRSLVAPELDVPRWCFLTNHAHVLICIGRNPTIRQRDIAHVVGITVGAVQRIVHELEDEGYVRSEKVGRRNHYEIVPNRALRHPLEQERTIEDFLSPLLG